VPVRYPYLANKFLEVTEADTAYTIKDEGVSLERNNEHFSVAQAEVPIVRKEEHNSKFLFRLKFDEMSFSTMNVGIAIKITDPTNTATDSKDLTHMLNGNGTKFQKGKFSGMY